MRILALGIAANRRLDAQATAPARADQSAALIAPGSFENLRGSITPSASFFLRNHHHEPELTMAEWRLRIEGQVARPIELSFSDLLEAPLKKMEAVLECAGNDARAGVLVSNGLWEGVALSYFLRQAAPGAAADRVLLIGADRGSLLEGAASFPYARVIPLAAAMAPEALVAFRLNSQFLPRRHGFPARSILAGQYAMNSVKWLERIVVLGPDDRPGEFYASGMDLLYRRTYNKEAPAADSRVSGILVKSRIVTPGSKARLAAGPHAISGLAWAGGSRVAAVSISVDGAKTWQLAKLDAASQPFRWVRWSFIWEATRGEHELMSRAQDALGNLQPLMRDPNRRDGYELNWCAPVSCLVR